MVEHRTPNPGVGGSSPSWPAKKSFNKVIKKIKDFLKESWMEIKKVVFPSKDEVIGSTKIVILTVLIVALFLGLIDIALSRLIRIIVF